MFNVIIFYIELFQKLRSLSASKLISYLPYTITLGPPSIYGPRFSTQILIVLHLPHLLQVLIT